MKAISDSSVLIALARIAAFPLLGALFEEVYIPMAVYREVVRQGRGRPGAREVSRAPGIQRMRIRGKASVSRLMATEHIGAGEAEAIRLAKELRIRTILINEPRPAKIADAMGLRVIGTAELLYLAKQLGFISRVKEKLDALLAAGFFMDYETYRKILRKAGEAA